MSSITMTPISRTDRSAITLGVACGKVYETYGRATHVAMTDFGEVLIAFAATTDGMRVVLRFESPEDADRFTAIVRADPTSEDLFDFGPEEFDISRDEQPRAFPENEKEPIVLRTSL